MGRRHGAGATEFYFATRQATENATLADALPHADPMYYLAQAAQFARNYINRIHLTGAADNLNLDDVSGPRISSYIEL